MPHKDPDARRAYFRAWCKRNRHKRRAYEIKNAERIAARKRELVEMDPDRYADGQLRATYGISIADYNRMHEAQRGLCAICSNPETLRYSGKLRRLAVDHCHKTGQLRGLLCAACNSGIGHMYDDPERVESAARYLRYHQLRAESDSGGSGTATTARIHRQNAQLKLVGT